MGVFCCDQSGEGTDVTLKTSEWGVLLELSTQIFEFSFMLLDVYKTFI